MPHGRCSLRWREGSELHASFDHVQPSSLFLSLVHSLFHRPSFPYMCLASRVCTLSYVCQRLLYVRSVMPASVPCQFPDTCCLHSPQHRPIFPPPQIWLSSDMVFFLFLFFHVEPGHSGGARAVHFRGQVRVPRLFPGRPPHLWLLPRLHGSSPPPLFFPPPFLPPPPPFFFFFLSLLLGPR